MRFRMVWASVDGERRGDARAQASPFSFLSFRADSRNATAPGAVQMYCKAFKWQSARADVRLGVALEDVADGE